MTHNYDQMDVLMDFISIHKLKSQRNENLRFKFKASGFFKDFTNGNEKSFYNEEAFIVKEGDYYAVIFYKLEDSTIYNQYRTDFQFFEVGPNKDLKIWNDPKTYQMQIIVSK